MQLTDPILTYRGMPGPPDNPPPDVFDRMIVEIAAFGTETVEEALNAFRDRVETPD